MREPKRKIEISTTRIMHKARALKSLRRPLLLTRAGMLLERVTKSFWPLWSWGFVIWAALSFGVFNQLSLELAYFTMLTGLVGLVVFLVMGIRSFHWPSISEAADRLDRSLKGRPLTALWDSQAIGAGDAASTQVWHAHVARMAEQATKAKPVEPDLKVSDRDPFGLRYVAATALVVSLLFGTFGEKNGLTDILSPTDDTALLSGPIYEGWIEPPRYTGLPAIYLNEVVVTDVLQIPEGSKVTLRLYGDLKNLAVSETLSGQPTPEQIETQSTELDFQVTQSGELRIAGAGGEDLAWQIDAIPDEPPMIAVTGPIDRSPRGETLLTFEAMDDYGVVGGTVRIDLNTDAIDRRYGLAADPEPRRAITLDVPLPFNGDTREFTDTIVEDLSKHPWAGLPITLHLNATDDIDQQALAEPEEVILPGRRFFDPLAAAIIEQRRDLLWNRSNSRRVSQVLRAISHIPEDLFDNESAYLVLRSALRRIEFNTVAGSALSGDARDDIAELLWRTALLVEDGNLSDAEERLRRAQERLSEALENGATDQEIAELTEELRRAMQDYLEQMARDAEQNPDQDQAQNGETREITSDQLQKMLDRIQELAREGRTEEAQELLEQLQQMMENMQTARRQQGQGEGEGQQAMRGLQDTLRQQQQLSDDAFRKLQEQFNGQPPQGQQPGQQPGQGTPGMGQGENGEPNEQSRPGAQELAQRQDALRQLLESQRQELPDAGTDEGRAARDALRQAERNMDEAGERLRQGDMAQALDEQSEALDALREGIENLGQELARNQDQNMGRQGEQAGTTDPNSQRDPLGRQSGTVGRIGSNENLMPGDDPFLRSRELMEEIRRRSGEKSRPRIELDYLERLLDRF